MNSQDTSKTPEKLVAVKVELPKTVEMPNAPKKLPKALGLPKCQGCEEEQPNQLAHVGPGGCLEEAFNAVYELK